MFPSHKIAFSQLDKDSIFILSSSKDKGQCLMWIKEAGVYEPCLLSRFTDLELMGKTFLHLSKTHDFTMQDNQPRKAVVKYQMVKGGVVKEAKARDISVPLTVYAEACFKEWKKKPHAIMLEHKVTNRNFCRFTVRVTDSGTEILWFDRFNNMSRMPMATVVPSS